MKFDSDDVNNRFLNADNQISKHSGFTHHHETQLREVLRSKRLRKTMLTFSLILMEILVVILMAVYFISPLNRISHFSVGGNRTVSSIGIARTMKLAPGDSMSNFLIHRHRLDNNAFRQNAQLKSVHVNWHRWNRVHVQLTEYPVVAYLKRNGRYFAVVYNGRAAQQRTTPNQIDPILINFKSSRTLARFIDSYKELPGDVKPDINKIVYSPDSPDPSRIHIYMNDGNQVYADYKNWSHKMKYYSTIARSMKKHGIINIELGAYSRDFKPARHR